MQLLPFSAILGGVALLGKEEDGDGCGVCAQQHPRDGVSQEGPGIFPEVFKQAARTVCGDSLT